MESSGSRPEMGDGGVAMLVKPTVSRPTLTLPPRNPAEAFIRGSDGASPSPMTFVSSLFAEQDPYAECKSFSQLLAGAMASPTAQVGDAFIEQPTDSALHNGIARMPTGGSFADRLAARGANQIVAASESPGSGRSNTARFKSMIPSRLPIPCSPYLTIPPGLSPTTLLDSPVLFSIGQAEPSPTTGTFPLPSFVQESESTGAPLSDTSKAKGSEEGGSPSFVFKPYPKLATNPYTVLASMGSYGLSHQQALAQVQAQAQSDGSSIAGTSPVSASSSVLSSLPSFTASNLVLPLQPQGPLESTVAPLTESSEKVSLSQVPAATYPLPHLVERPSDDGYNWRKYGQKQVKGGEYPRSYYKCTNTNCPVKKKVERSHDGQVTEIVYKGEHNHAKPQATRRSNMSGLYISDGAGREASHAMALERADTSHAVASADSDRSSADPSSTSRWQSGGLPGSPEASLGSTSDDEGEDGDASKAEDGNEDEPDSKHRRVERSKDTLSSAPLRTIREARVVVQTTSEVDILDDGYRWRKYGQKVVKGNAHPRSYYKCTNIGCSVRKHVERSSIDSKAVITTYEGKHNHDVPAARNSNHDKIGTTTSVTFPPGSGHTAVDMSNTNTLTKPSGSLQEQLFGKLFEDRFNAGDKMTVSAELGRSAFMNGTFTSEQNRGQGGIDFSAHSAMSSLGSGLTGGRSIEGSDLFVQGYALRPKEEPGDVPPIGSSLPIYPSRLSSFVAQSLASGP